MDENSLIRGLKFLHVNKITGDEESTHNRGTQDILAFRSSVWNFTTISNQKSNSEQSCQHQCGYPLLGSLPLHVHPTVSFPNS